MIRNHFIFALRVLSTNKVFALVSMLGLSIGIAATVLVVGYAEFELSYDTFFKNQKNIYRLQHNRIANNEVIYKKAMTFPEVGLAMKDYFPEVEAVGRLFPASINIEPVYTAITDSGDRRSFSEPYAYLADSTFCNIFDLDFIHGDPRSALAGPDKIILSRSAALRYFGKLDVIGKELKGNVSNVTVSGVFNDLPANSHLKFDVLLSWWKVYEDRSRFTWDGFYNYVVLKNGTDVQGFEKKLPAFAQSYMGDYYKNQPGVNSQFELQPLQSIHLDSHLDGEMRANGNRNVIYALLIVAGFIIVIAVVNHVNLNASRSLERIKEIGIRKTIGSTKAQLSLQFLFESLLLNLSAAVVGLAAVWLLYPSFNQLFDSGISLMLFGLPVFWLAMTAFILAVSIISGFYPAFMLTRFKVYEALKGLSVGSKKIEFTERTGDTAIYSLACTDHRNLRIGKAD
ncbi:MAG: ABC transporter permease [Bacteroidota bacterium]